MCARTVPARFTSAVRERRALLDKNRTHPNAPAIHIQSGPEDSAAATNQRPARRCGQWCPAAHGTNEPRRAFGCCYSRPGCAVKIVGHRLRLQTVAYSASGAVFMCSAGWPAYAFRSSVGPRDTQNSALDTKAPVIVSAVWPASQSLGSASARSCTIGIWEVTGQSPHRLILVSTLPGSSTFTAIDMTRWLSSCHPMRFTPHGGILP